MKYLNTKPGSIEEVAANMSKYAAESEYQQMFKKELEKAGKGIGAMTPAEKKAFFNKIDSKYTAKNEAVDNPYAVGMAVAKKMKNDEPPLKKSTITKAHDIAKSIAKDDKKEEVEESAASDKAKAMGLTYLHFGRYGKDGKVTHKNIGGNLTRVGKDEKPIKSSDKASKDQPNKSSKVTSDVVDVEPRELKKQAKKYGLTVKIGSGDPDDGYEVEFKGPQKNLVKYYKNYMGYDGKDFKGLGGLGNISENYPHKMYSKDGKEVEAKTPEDHKKYADMGYTHKEDMKEDVQEAVRIVAKNGNFKKTFQTRKQAADYLQKHPELDDAKIIAEADLSKKQIKMVHNETHTFMTKDMNKSKKDAKGEKEIVDPEPKMKQESIQDTIANVWKMSAEELEKIKTEAKYMKAQRMSQYKAEDEKNKKGTADTGSKATKVDIEPSVDYKN